MKTQLITLLISTLLKMFTPELTKKFLDKLFDFIEVQVLGSASTLDDAVVLPLVAMLRSAMSVPDYEDKE